MKAKYLFLLMGLLATISVAAQVTPETIDVFQPFTEVQAVYEFNSPRAQKHLKAKEWVAKTFGDYKSVLQFEDDDNCKIIIKGLTQLPVEEDAVVSAIMIKKTRPQLKYSITIDSRDDKFRIKVEDIHIKTMIQNILLGKPSSSKETIQTIYEFCKYEDIYNYDGEIEKLNMQVDSLKNLDVSQMKRKDVERWNNEIIKVNEKIKEKEVYRTHRKLNYDKRAENIKINLVGIFTSLENALKQTDDF